jgi:membrane protein implicated in regulation of membrane protease activity
VDALTLWAAGGFALVLAGSAVLLGCGMFHLPLWPTALAGLAAGGLQAAGTLWYIRRRFTLRQPKRGTEHGPRRND